MHPLLDYTVDALILYCQMLLARLLLETKGGFAVV